MTPQSTSGIRLTIISRLCCAMLIVVHLMLLAWSTVSNSVTFDEYAHLPAGIAYWKQGWRAFAMYNMSPPLVRLIAAAPVVIGMDVKSPDVATDLKHGLQNAHWDYGRTFERANAARYQPIFVIGRLALLPVSCLGLWLVWRWAGELYGVRSAVAAGAMWAFNPDVIAHGSVVTTDVAAAVFMLAASYMWWKFCLPGRARWGILALAAVAFAAAQLSKFTTTILFPMFLAMAIAGTVQRWIHWRRAVIALAVTLGVTWIAINAIYGFRGTFAPLRDHQFYSRPLPQFQRALPAWWPSLLPSDFLEGFDIQKFETETGVPAYLLGESYYGGRWDYYPVALGCKLPVGMIGLILLAGGSAIVRPRTGDARELPVLLALLVFAVAMNVLTHVNIGVRHILPMYPLAMILLSRTWRDRRTTRAAKAMKSRAFWSVPRVGWALLGAATLECLLAAPRFLSFMNLAVGGNRAGWRIVNDSNFDWGQGLLDLKRWSDEHGRPPIVMAYFGRVNPATYGIDYSPITAPAPGAPVVAISTYYLNGLSHRIPTDAGATNWVSLPYANELRAIEPLDRAGPTIYLYRAEDVARAARRARQSR